MKTFLALSLVFLITITGCITPSTSYKSSDDIVLKYFNQYTQISSVDVETDNHEIAAILKTFTCDLIKKPSSEWKEVKVREKAYISVLQTNSISSTYTLLANYNEIYISDRFLSSVIEYYEAIEPGYAYFAGNFISEVSVRFIIKMDNYEYDKIKFSR